MKFSSLVTGIAAAGLVMAPVAAQAGTKASTAVVSPVDFGSRASAGVAKTNQWKAGTWIAIVLATGAFTWGMIELLSDEKSRG